MHEHCTKETLSASDTSFMRITKKVSVDFLLAYPIRSAEVDGFGKIISLIEATVIGSRESDDKFSSTLIRTDHLPVA